MKKASKITIICSFVCILIGIIICVVALKTANDNNTELFTQTKNSNGDLIYNLDFSNVKITKVLLNINKAEVNVIGKSEKSYIEIKNLNAYEYSISLENKVLKVDKNVIYSFFTNLFSGSFGFDGFRNYFRLVSHNKNKEINIYLSDELDIKVFDISDNKGNITFNNISCCADLKINSSAGNITIDGNDKFSSLYLNGKECNLTINNTEFTKLSVDILKGDFLYKTNNKEFKCTSKTSNGKVYFFGEDKGSFYNSEESDADTSNYSVNISEGNITFDFIQAE